MQTADIFLASGIMNTWSAESDSLLHIIIPHGKEDVNIIFVFVNIYFISFLPKTVELSQIIYLY